MGNWIYHGKDRKQCFYRPECTICYIKTLIGIFRIAGRRDQ